MIKIKDILFEQEGKPKAIVMAGSAGAGKTYLLNQLDIKTLKNYNPDKYVEDENHPYYNNLSAASGQVEKDVIAASDRKESFIWDTTASNSDKVKMLLDKGYDVFMVMVYTHPMISFINNFGRPERKVPKSAVFSTWQKVYSLVDDYKKMLGDNFAIFVNDFSGKYDKEIKGFNNAAKKGSSGIEAFLEDYMEKEGREKFRSTFRKDFELGNEDKAEFDKLIQQTDIPQDDETAIKALKKDFEKMSHHYKSGKYGIDRLKNLYQKNLDKREKLRQTELANIQQIANMLSDKTFNDLLQHSDAGSIKSKVQSFL